jgi:ubiquinone/menaquinone biosynthesis C-methylase UbiE
MPAMTKFEAVLCRSAPWRAVTRRIVLPWALQGFRPQGDVLEIGAGSGAMAEQLLASFPSASVTATDFDDEMVASIAARLAPFGSRAVVRQADATALPFPDGAFDAVLGWIMLHHTIEWERALDEALRVTRPGGHVVGYDLLATPPMRVLHRHQGEGHRTRVMRLPELRDYVSSRPIEQPRIKPGAGGLVVRFVFRKASA